MGRPIRVIADDLTGAADAGAALVGRGPAVVLVLGTGIGEWEDPSAVVVAADTGTREGTAAAAAAAVTSLAGRLPPGSEVVKKIDSALRGYVAAELAALHTALPGRVMILAPAFPRNGRITRDGVQHVDGVPLHRGDHWALEAVDPPESLAALVAPWPSSRVGLDLVRGPAGHLARALDGAAGLDRVVICDAETDGDLDRIVEGGRTYGSEVVWVGSAGLASALARARGGDPCAAPPTLRRGPYLAVIGSAAAAARRQAAALVREGATLVELPADFLATTDMTVLSSMSDQVLSSARAGDTVVTVGGGVEARRAAAITVSLAHAVTPAAMTAGALVLTGGATARAVLDACEVASLELVAELDPGIVLARPVGRFPVPVITKSGSFGDDRTLVRAVQKITPEEGSTSCGS